MNRNSRKTIESDEDFLEALGGQDPEVAALLDYVRQLERHGERERAVALLELLVEECERRGGKDDALLALEELAVVAGEGRKPDLERRVLGILGGGERARRLLEAVGWHRRPAAEAVRSVVRVRSLRRGVVCLDPTWGMGTVMEVDILHGEVVVDFDGKRQHGMSLEQAVDRLRLVGGEHFLAHVRGRTERLRELAATEPAAVVKWALRDCGPLSVERLKGWLVPGVVGENEWSEYWQTAREVLKRDPEVVLPGRTGSLLRLKERGVGLEGLERTIRKADVSDLPELLAELKRTFGGEAPPSVVSVLKERANECLRDRRLSAAERAWLALCLREVGIGDVTLGEAVDAGELADGGLAADLLRRATVRQARWLSTELIRLAGSAGGQRVAERLLEAASSSTAMLEAVIEELEKAGWGRVVATFLQEQLRSADCPAAVITWVLRNPCRARAQVNIPAVDVIRLAVNRLNSAAVAESSAERRRLSAALRSDGAVGWLLRETGAEELADIVNLIHGGGIWQADEKGELLGKIIRQRPELRHALRPAESVTVSHRVTSWRSYREKQQLLQRIVTDDIPRAAADIARARAYGDLRENYEYKAAKEHQGLLLRRREELEEALAHVTPSDFSGVETETVAPGTEVEVERDGAGREVFSILGVWDHDERLGIVSCEAPLARQLLGRRAGEVVALPESFGRGKLRIIAVRPLSERVRAWVRGEDLEGPLEPSGQVSD